MDVTLQNTRVASEGIVTPKDFKEIEGRRIAPVLGAIAALPAAGLISLGPSGAPLFALAVAFAAAAYVFWVLLDAVYHLSCLEVCDHAEHGRLRHAAYHFQSSQILYGAASGLLSIVGFGAHHSTIRAPISVEAGFIVAVGLALVVIVHVWLSVRGRNGLDRMVDEAARRQGVPISF